MNEEIAQAMASPAGPIDEDEELEEELERMRQEQLDEEMLKTGPVPHDKVSSLPAAANGERETTLPQQAARELRRTDPHVTVKNKATPQESEEEAELRKLQAEMAM